MCGIGGVLLRSGANIDVPAVLGGMLQRQQHRGPDGQGIWIADDRHVGLCHNRLAILDLSASGKQPMASADGSLTVVFNGEIFNWQALRTEFESQGEVFHSGTEIGRAHV